MGRSFEPEPNFRRRQTVELESRNRAKVARRIQAVVRGFPDAFRVVDEPIQADELEATGEPDTRPQHGFDIDGNYR